MPAIGGRTTTLSARLVEAAADLTARHGWASVTMARLADDVGVSRQTVYNEIGGKPALAEAMVLRELGLFLEGVHLRFVEADDVVSGVRAAARGVLEQAEGNPLLRAILSSTHGAESDLLPLLTTHSEALLETASDVINHELTRFGLGLPQPRLAAAIDMVVRLVLSHVMQPARPPAQTADEIAWIAERALSDPRR